MKSAISAVQLLLLIAAPAAAQTVPQMRLAAADGQLRDEFTNVTSIRELRDGRVLVADGHEHRLVVGDFRAGTVTPVSRRGQGPEEYSSVRRLLALGGDTTLLIAGNNRVLVLVGSRATASWPDDNLEMNPADGTGTISGVDTTGKVVLHEVRRRSVADQRTIDTTWIVRYTRSSRASTTLAHGLRIQSSASEGRGNEVAMAGSPGATSTSKPYLVPLLQLEQAAVFPDGWVAVAKFEPYQVQWCSPSGACQSGPTIEQRPAYSDAHKREFIALLRTEYPQWPTDVSRYTGWPATVPPFRHDGGITYNALTPMPDGRLLIERVPNSSRPSNTYDIIDRRGLRVATLQMLPTQRVVGFGLKSIYTVAVDADGLEQVHRHPW